MMAQYVNQAVGAQGVEVAKGGCEGSQEGVVISVP